MGSASTAGLALPRVEELERNEEPAYTALDLRLAWRLRHGLELAFTGRNLLGGHAEYGPAATRMQHESAAFVSVAWQP